MRMQPDAVARLQPLLPQEEMLSAFSRGDQVLTWQAAWAGNNGQCSVFDPLAMSEWGVPGGRRWVVARGRSCVLHFYRPSVFRLPTSAFISRYTWARCAPGRCYPGVLGWRRNRMRGATVRAATPTFERR